MCRLFTIMRFGTDINEPTLNALYVIWRKWSQLRFQVVSQWKHVTALIVKREAVLNELESFERQASCPGRLLNKGYSADINCSFIGSITALTRCSLLLQTEYHGLHVCLGLLVTTVSPAKMAEVIKTLLVVDLIGPDPHGKGHFWGDNVKIFLHVTLT